MYAFAIKNVSVVVASQLVIAMALENFLTKSTSTGIGISARNLKFLSRAEGRLEMGRDITDFRTQPYEGYYHHETVSTQEQLSATLPTEEHENFYHFTHYPLDGTVNNFVKQRQPRLVLVRLPKADPAYKAAKRKGSMDGIYTIHQRSPSKGGPGQRYL